MAVDFYDLKGKVLSSLRKAGAANLECIAGKEKIFVEGETADLNSNGQRINAIQIIN